MSTNEDRNLQAALSYVLLFVSGLFFLITKKDPFIRFHAMQSIVVFGVLTLLMFLFSLTIILSSLSSLLGILMFGLWLILIYKAWSGEEWEVPVFGAFVRKWVKRF